MPAGPPVAQTTLGLRNTAISGAPAAQGRPGPGPSPPGLPRLGEQLDDLIALVDRHAGPLHRPLQASGHVLAGQGPGAGRSLPGIVVGAVANILAVGIVGKATPRSSSVAKSPAGAPPPSGRGRRACRRPSGPGPWRAQNRSPPPARVSLCRSACRAGVAGGPSAQALGDHRNLNPCWARRGAAAIPAAPEPTTRGGHRQMPHRIPPVSRSQQRLRLRPQLHIHLLTQRLPAQAQALGAGTRRLLRLGRTQAGRTASAREHPPWRRCAQVSRHRPNLLGIAAQ